MVVGCLGNQGCEIAPAMGYLSKQATRFLERNRVALFLAYCGLALGRLFALASRCTLFKELETAGVDTVIVAAYGGV